MHGIKQTFTKVKEGRQQQMVQFRRLSIGIITWLNWNKVQVDIILNTGDLPFPFESVREGFHKHSMIRLTVDDAMLSFQAHITLRLQQSRKAPWASTREILVMSETVKKIAVYIFTKSMKKAKPMTQCPLCTGFRGETCRSLNYQCTKI